METSNIQSDNFNRKYVSRPKERFEPALPEMSGVDGGANQVPAYLGQLQCDQMGRLFSIFGHLQQ